LNKKYLWGVLIISVFFLIAALSTKIDNSPHLIPVQGGHLNYNKSIFAILHTQNPDKDRISLLAEKSKYKLTLFYDKKPLKSYPVVLGFNPVDDKLKEGDGCTPEGVFNIKAHYNHPHWSKFLWLNYPTVDSWKKYNLAKMKGKLKFTDSIGGQIGIHGVPDNDDSVVEKKNNWTNGCISLKNKDVNELYEVIKDGTVVEIVH
jgi:murein L,D-transpeptidase YafK